jgi:transcription initiation factor TFIID TATA-box-binding protein
MVSEAKTQNIHGMKWRNTNNHLKKYDTQFVSCAQNLFSEQKYIMACKTESNEAQVNNLVGTCRVCSCLGTIDLLAVSNLLLNALFEKQKFAVITIRLGEPTCTVLLFTSGKMVLTGCKSLLDCILASKIVANLLKEGFPGNVFTLDVIKIQNIVGNAHVPMQSDEVLDLQYFYSNFNIFCTCQPNMFPGLIYRPTSLPIVLLIFFSGKVVITGAKNLPDVYTGWTHMLQLLHTYTMKKSELRGNTKPKQFP